MCLILGRPLAKPNLFYFYVIFMAAISAFHSRFFRSTSFRKKELRSSRAATFASFKNYILFKII
ncbi:hypothetical protein HY04_00120 [Kaistella antarctica]|uniref:Uncharacterized protein n=1 Tax=Kaistella antarctica TaxID=266748 RepID=A0ABR4U0F4_9FLAO|nr:hypothetical protein HY04_00120 [Kaistella antarctica]